MAKQYVFKKIVESRKIGDFVAHKTETIFVSPLKLNPPTDFLRVEYSSNCKDTFPNCCKTHRSYHEDVTKWYNQLIKEDRSYLMLKKYKWFKESFYKNLPEKILNALSYTEYILVKNCEADNINNAIIPFMIDVKRSFGYPLFGYEKYLQYLHFLVTNLYNNNKGKSKKNFAYILRYIEQCKKDIYKDTDTFTPINTLLKLRQKWLDLFPLELSGYKDKREQIIKILPFFKNIHEEHETGLLTATIITGDELVSHLKKATAILINQNTNKLGKGFTLDTLKTEITFLAEKNYIIEEAKLLEKYSKNELDYVELIEKWIQAQIRLFERKRYNRKSQSTKKEWTFLKLFKQNKDRMDYFFELLKRPEIGAIDENDNWIFKPRKSSIAACFVALEELEYISPNIKKDTLYDLITTKITFSLSKKYFREGANNKDVLRFQEIFKRYLR